MWDLAKALMGIVVTIFIITTIVRVIDLPEEDMSIRSLGRSSKGVMVDFVNGWNDEPIQDIDSISVMLQYSKDNNIKLIKQ